MNNSALDFSGSFLGPALKEIGETTLAKAQMKFDRIETAQANFMRDANTIKGLHKRILQEFDELKSDGLIVDYWSEYEQEFKAHVTKIRGMLESSAAILEEQLEIERAASATKKKGLGLNQLSDEITVNGIPWSELKHKLASQTFDFYSFWVSSKT